MSKVLYIAELAMTPQERRACAASAVLGNLTKVLVYRGSLPQW
jgi:hypothetical protein